MAGKNGEKDGERKRDIKVKNFKFCARTILRHQTQCLAVDRASRLLLNQTREVTVEEGSRDEGVRERERVENRATFHMQSAKSRRKYLCKLPV